MACEVRFAILAAEDLVGVEVGVVDEAHARRAGLLAPRVQETCSMWCRVCFFFIIISSLGVDAVRFCGQTD